MNKGIPARVAMGRRLVGMGGLGLQLRSQQPLLVRGASSPPLLASLTRPESVMDQALEQCFSAREGCLAWDIWRCPEMFLRVPTGIWWLEARDVVELPTVHRRAPQQRITLPRMSALPRPA